jgi:hypothetical protein
VATTLTGQPIPVDQAHAIRDPLDALATDSNDVPLAKHRLSCTFLFAAQRQRLGHAATANVEGVSRHVPGDCPVGKIIARALEAVLAVAMLSLAVERLYAGKEDAAVNNAIFAVAVIAVVETLLWLQAARSREVEVYPQAGFSSEGSRSSSSRPWSPMQHPGCSPGKGLASTNPVACCRSRSSKGSSAGSSGPIRGRRSWRRHSRASRPTSRSSPASHRRRSGRRSASCAGSRRSRPAQTGFELAEQGPSTPC